MTARPAREVGGSGGGWGTYLVHERPRGPSHSILFQCSYGSFSIV